MNEAMNQRIEMAEDIIKVVKLLDESIDPHFAAVDIMNDAYCLSKLLTDTLHRDSLSAHRHRGLAMAKTPCPKEEPNASPTEDDN